MSLGTAEFDKRTCSFKNTELRVQNDYLSYFGFHIVYADAYWRKGEKPGLGLRARLQRANWNMGKTTWSKQGIEPTTSVTPDRCSKPLGSFLLALRAQQCDFRSTWRNEGMIERRRQKCWYRTPKRYPTVFRIQEGGLRNLLSRGKNYFFARQWAGHRVCDISKNN